MHCHLSSLQAAVSQPPGAPMLREAADRATGEGHLEGAGPMEGTEALGQAVFSIYTEG